MIKKFKVNEICPELFSKYFYYDSTSQSCLRNKNTRNSRSLKHTKAGSLHIHKTGRRVYEVQLKRKKYLASRIVWVLHNSRIPMGYQVDHVDGNSENNRIENLRLVTPKNNAQNQKMHKRNTSGKTGVKLNSNKDGWCPNYYDLEGKIKTKYFRFKKHGGKDKAFELASQWRDEKIKELNDLHGQQYTYRHGKPIESEENNDASDS